MRRIRIFVILCLLAITTLVITSVSLWKSNRYLPWVDVPESVHSQEDYETYLSENGLSTIQIKSGSKTFSLCKKDFSENYAVVDNLKFTDFILGKNPKYNITWKFDEDKLHALLEKYYVKAESAYLHLTDAGTYTVVPEKADLDYNITKASALIEASLLSLKDAVDISSANQDDYVTSEDLQNSLTDMKWLDTWHITYKDGTTITAKDLRDYWNEDLLLLLGGYDYTSLFQKLHTAFDTTNSNLYFKPTDAVKSISIPYKTYGEHLNEDAEEEFILKAIADEKSYNSRTPCLYGYNNFDDTYIEVSIAKQHVWYYDNGKLVRDSDCVTGDISKDAGTPTGVFYVSEKVNGKNLRGKDYTTWVNKWMRITNTGIGLHDAYWRGSFGEEIYKRRGSHGCINLPKDFAYQLYDAVDKGIPVVIYDE